ncbi:Serine/threonine-protein kinase 17A [Perkinsus olseni]|uniref:Serine/threonine-protein kinase 17A n=1 Tax=Perkinsus olseni TaxID=32597 RepID=A0A7J6LGC2_PEROL|nr:Serine/threonine-protein kinase 17A [Perkinsus olseni]
MLPSPLNTGVNNYARSPQTMGGQRPSTAGGDRASLPGFIGAYRHQPQDTSPGAHYAAVHNPKALQHQMPGAGIVPGASPFAVGLHNFLPRMEAYELHRKLSIGTVGLIHHAAHRAHQILQVPAGEHPGGGVPRHPVAIAEPPPAAVGGRAQKRSCPRMHPLAPFVTPTGGYACNVCRKRDIKRGIKLYSCRKCDYDVCADCYGGRMESEAKEREEREDGRLEGPRGSPVKGPSPSMLRKIQVLLDKRDTLCAHASAWFKKFDGDRDGVLSFTELADLCARLNSDLQIPGVSDATAMQCLKKFDVDGDEMLNQKEFINLYFRLLLKVKAQYAPVKVRREFFLDKKPGRPDAHYEVMKVINKKSSHMDPQELEQEIKNMKKMDHPHILKLFEYFEDYNNVYLILELCEGGELMKVIEDTYTKSRGKKSLTEGWIAGLYGQILEAVSYCHSHGIIHKDIKAENIMLLLTRDKSRGKNPFEIPPHVVLIDFGLAEAFDPGRPFVSRHVAGTPYTMAPEVWNATLSRSNTFGLKCDVYSLGCVLFHLFCGKPPVIARSMKAQDWLKAISVGPDWKLLRHVSPHATQLVKKMMTYSDRLRPTCAQCLTSPWFEVAPNDNIRALGDHVMQGLVDYSRRSVFERTVLLEIATQVHAVSVQEINRIFRMLDTEKQGIISKQTCVTGLAKLGVPQNTAMRAVEAMDMDGDGRIDYTELVAGILCVYDSHLDDRLWKAFSKLDLNGDGKLDRHEIRKLLQCGEVSQMGLVPAQMEIDAIIQEMDTDRDGLIEYSEFKARFSPQRRQ